MCAGKIASMSDEHDEQTPPEGLEAPADASVSTELPVVVLGDSEDERVTTEVPRERLLQGRLPERVVLYPIYALNVLAGLIAMQFAFTTKEWSALVVGLAWFLLYVWYWFYGVAYRYRRPLLKYSSVIVILGLTVSLAYFSIERAQPQMAMVARTQLVERGEASSLYWVAIFTLIASGLLIAHLVFLGRGYRRKRS